MRSNLLTVTVTMTEDKYTIGGFLCRRWRGTTAAGTPVDLLVQSIRPLDYAGAEALSAELGVPLMEMLRED